MIGLGAQNLLFHPVIPPSPQLKVINENCCLHIVLLNMECEKSLNFLLSIAESFGCHKSTGGKYWEIYHGWKIINHRQFWQKNKLESHTMVGVLFL